MRPIYNSQEKMFGESGRERKAFTLDNTDCRWGGYLKKKEGKKSEAVSEETEELIPTRG